MKFKMLGVILLAIFQFLSWITWLILLETVNITVFGLPLILLQIT